MDTKITAHQLFTFAALSILGGSLLVISSTVTAVAKQDVWLSALVTMGFGLLMMWVYCFLGTRYIGLTLIGITQKIFGKWIGRIVSAAYLFYFFTLAYGVPWWIGSFGAHTMHETPVPVILLPYVIALVIGVYYGLEAIVRTAELAFIFVSVLFVISIVLVLPHIKIGNLLPVFESGAMPILKGAYVISPFIVFTGVALLMIFPNNVNDMKNGKKALVKGFLWCSTVEFVTILVSVLVLGNVVVAKSSFPTILLAREINIGTVLTRLEYAISSMWTVTEFMIGMLFFYITIKGVSELLGLKDHKKITVPFGLIVLLYAWIIYPSSIEVANWLTVGFMPHATLFGFVIPALMLFVYLIKKWVFKKA